jgi:hypothetical protein
MSHNCQQSICVDKPSLNKLNENKSTTGVFKPTEDELKYPERPLYRTEFGNITWRVIHRMASMYPDKPNEEDKMRMKNFFEGLATHFPCPECAEHFKEGIKS